MKFDINNYKGKYAMHCKTEEEAREFCDHVRNNNNPSIVFRMYGKNTCFNLNSDNHASKKFYEEHGYTILEWSDFTTEFTKADLKDGMVVEYNNGERGIVLKENLVSEYGYLKLESYNSHLEFEGHRPEDWLIKKVYETHAHRLDTIFETENLTLIWERKEKPKPVEMTLEEVCKALGKEIKIVKG